MRRREPRQTATATKQYVVQLKLTDDGAKLFADATTDNVGNYLPIVYDGETISYPQVKEAITGGTFAQDFRHEDI